MLFSSLSFAVFLPFAWTVFWLLPKGTARRRALLLLSYIFYGFWDVRFLSLIFFSTFVDFSCGLGLQREGMQPPESSLLRQVLGACWLPCLATIGMLLCPAFLEFLTTGEKDFAQALRHCAVAVAGYAGVVALLGKLGRGEGATPRTRRLTLAISVATNLGLLGYFKYSNFFLESVGRLAASMGMEGSLGGLNIILPVGLSFYTFQTMSYTIDAYRGRLTPERHLLDFALYVAFFPQLVAGPIERAKDLLPRLSCDTPVVPARLLRGAHLILIGLLKKVAVADVLVNSVAYVYGNPEQASSSDVVFGTVCFAIQILCDFSGYTDIARGTAKLFGVELMENFRMPYLARNPPDFWRRWHVSLSTWLRDYLYIPLGGSRAGRWTAYRNVVLTMLLGGLWHGAAWNFVLWGAYHGVLIVGYRMLTGTSIGAALDRVPKLGRVGCFFLLTCLGWMIFRVESLADLGILLGRLCQFDFGLSAPRPGIAFFLALPMLVGRSIWRSALFERVRGRLEYPALVGGAYAVAVFALLLGAGAGTSGAFVYFQF